MFGGRRGGGVISSKVPKALQEILKDEKKRQKLVIYINPPYAEAGNSSTEKKTGKHKALVAKGNKVNQRYKEVLGRANNELFAQFFIRIYTEISGCILGAFSTLKYVNSQNFIKFRETFKAKFLEGFITPADTFDNVRGQFPIGFLVWETSKKQKIESVEVKAFDRENRFLGNKKFYGIKDKTINHWLRSFQSKSGNNIAYLMADAPGFQQNNHIAIIDIKGKAHIIYQGIASENLIESCIYLSVRQVIEATWINDRDQFYAPNSLWEEDKEFQSDCLAFALFHGQNKISSQNGINHFIPFTESEIGAKGAFKSDFMTRFMRGKVELDNSSDSLFGGKSMSEKLEFSPEAKAVFEAGREVFAYYHSQDFNANVDASLYDIKEFFQGRNLQGKMNPPSKAEDSHYKTLIATLTDTLNTLAKKLEPKIYEYGFLKE